MSKELETKIENLKKEIGLIEAEINVGGHSIDELFLLEDNLSATIGLLELAEYEYKKFLTGRG